MRRISRNLIAAIALAFGISSAFGSGAGLAAGQGNCTVSVHVGQSIQAAIDGAQTGATVCVGPGTYQENLLIAKDGITLQGAGPEKTVLVPPAQPVEVCTQLQITPIDLEPTGINGICVGKLDSAGNILATVNDVRVTGFTVQGFPGVGIVFAGTSRIRADHNVAAGNGAYGITAFASSHGRFDDNASSGSGDAGIYIGDSPHADFTIDNNTSSANRWGILARDASAGRITGNTLDGNCSGLVFLNDGTLAGVHHWVATDNIVTHNDVNCPAGELPFTLTGLGILIAGGDHIVLQNNTVRSNQPSGSPPPSIINGVALAGGIVVVSSASISVFPGYFGSVATNNTIVHNTALDNLPVDLAYDGLGTGNRFRSNICSTSNPAGLCRG
jgi:parallel beta-helix repeat protein